MSKETPQNAPSEDMASTDYSNTFVTLTIDDQLVGIPVLSVHDVLGPQKITRIPRADAAISGVLNLRGKIVTAIDLRQRLGLASRSADQTSMNVVVERLGELYSLVVDSVGQVITVSSDSYEPAPATLDARWRAVTVGIYRLEEELLVILDVPQLLDFGNVEAA